MDAAVAAAARAVEALETVAAAAAATLAGCWRQLLVSCHQPKQGRAQRQFIAPI
jgi:hypothetical protein